MKVTAHGPFVQMRASSGVIQEDETVVIRSCELIVVERLVVRGILVIVQSLVTMMPGSGLVTDGQGKVEIWKSVLDLSYSKYRFNVTGQVIGYQVVTMDRGQEWFRYDLEE